MQEVYKVVRVVDGKYLSAFVGSSPDCQIEHILETQYEVGKPTKPLYSVLYAFDSLEEAKHFINLSFTGYDYNMAVFLASAIIDNDNPLAFKFGLVGDTEEEWLKNLEDRIADPTDFGIKAVPCSEITLIKEVFLSRQSKLPRSFISKQTKDGY